MLGSQSAPWAVAVNALRCCGQEGELWEQLPEPRQRDPRLQACWSFCSSLPWSLLIHGGGPSLLGGGPSGDRTRSLRKGTAGPKCLLIPVGEPALDRACGRAGACCSLHLHPGTCCCLSHPPGLFSPMLVRAAQGPGHPAQQLLPEQPLLPTLRV